MSQGWIPVNSREVLDEAVLASNAGPVLVFKHSTRCPISAGACRSLESLDTGKIPVYWIDVIAHRDLSMAAAERLGVRHESPQAILLRNGEVVWHASHGSVRTQRVMEEARLSD